MLAGIPQMTWFPGIQDAPLALCWQDRWRMTPTPVPTANPKLLTIGRAANRWIVAVMEDLCRLIWYAVAGLFRSRAALQAEVLVLRHQLNVLRRKAPTRTTFSAVDRIVFAGFYRLAPGVRDALKILKPETVIRWHRIGFRTYCAGSHDRGGRPTIPTDLRLLIREMSVANPLWGAPRIHGELLKLGSDIGQTTVAKIHGEETAATVARLEDLSWQSCRRHHVGEFVCDPENLVSAVVRPPDLAALPLAASLAGSHPNAEWIARQLTEACGWKEAPRYLVRDRDGAYGVSFIRRLKAMGIRDRPTRRGRHGKTDMRKGSSVRSDGIVLIMLLSLASSTSVTCSFRIRNTTTRFALTSR
jgi:hypothetical protein